MSLSFAVIGSGALGGLYGGLLAKAGHDVHFVFRSDFDHVVRHGLKVESVFGNFELPQPNAVRTAADLPPCDVTILATKTTVEASAKSLLSASTAKGGYVLTLQNGLAVEDDVAKFVGPERTLGGCAFLCSNRIAPGHIRHLDQGRIAMGSMDRTNDKSVQVGKAIVESFENAGVPCRWTDDLVKTRWTKLMWNIPFNGLSVVLNASTKEIISDSSATQLATTIIEEVHQGAALCGVQIDKRMIKKTIDATRTMVPYDSSMRLDFLHRRPLEINAIFERPIAAVDSHDSKAMPHVRMLAKQLRFLDARQQSPSA